ncbi:hypothetical protein [Alkaliphilus peptidifermentans]|uniref:Uncharacterized protein n=1 Tax=Alkaliphilus peptidifermentans DSM 18978 TaxID=1120976 RepID=A0A1G5CMJ1_9FIRM|nr:hypothetical protein [Alkaliphilus peptidifermentans]SCY03518.1 hypothetical protein SAMN03080606_00707 [Alkaliphilus peptidifermentans DSM 18978]
MLNTEEFNKELELQVIKEELIEVSQLFIELLERYLDKGLIDEQSFQHLIKHKKEFMQQ